MDTESPLTEVFDVSQSVLQIDRVTLANSAAAEQTSASREVLQIQTLKPRNPVATLRMVLMAAGNPTRRAHPADRPDRYLSR